MGVRIVVDSTLDMREELRSRLTVVPLTIYFGEEAFVDGVTMTGSEFYQKLVESDVLPTTSQAGPYQFQQIFEEMVQAGNQVVCITLASKLSGTCQSARIAAAEYPEQVFVVDSETVTIGGGILAEYALQLADQGISAEEVAQKLELAKGKIRVLALVDTLEYLKRGGRISKTVAFAGELLSIKPVISVQDGQLHLIGKARGSKQGNNLLVKEIQKAGGVDFSMPLLLGYSGMSDVLLKKYMEDSAALWTGNCDDLPYALVGSVVGTHAGPGAIAVAFFSEV